MKIGIISDTHGAIQRVEEIIQRMEKIDLLIHLGDHYGDGILLKDKFEIPILGVKGNCDMDGDGPEEIVHQMGEQRILICHGHQYGVNWGLERLYYRSLELECNGVLYGHTHIPLHVTHGQVMILNPGSTSFPRGGSRPSYGLIEIIGKEMQGRIVEVGEW